MAKQLSVTKVLINIKFKTRPIVISFKIPPGKIKETRILTKIAVPNNIENKVSIKNGRLDIPTT